MFCNQSPWEMQVLFAYVVHLHCNSGHVFYLWIHLAVHKTAGNVTLPTPYLLHFGHSGSIDTVVLDTA